VSDFRAGARAKGGGNAVRGGTGRTVVVIRISGIKRKRGTKWVVRPGRAHVAPGQQIAFRVAGTAAAILIPKPKLFETLGGGRVSGGVLVLPVRNDGAAHIRVKDGARVRPRKSRTPIECRYAVYCGAGEDFAVGNSSPAIIIDPPAQQFP